jgi:photosystem II stability/assembly factor-like uncharacterized protein
MQAVSEIQNTTETKSAPTRLAIVIIAASVFFLCPGSNHRLQAQTYWQPAGLADSNVTSVSVSANETVVACVDFRRLYMSTNGGTIWTQIPAPDIFISQGEIDSTGTIYAADVDAMDNGLQKSTDNGAHWIVLSDTATIGCYSLGLSPVGSVFASFADLHSAMTGKIFHSTDGGTTWNVSSTLQNATFLGNLSPQSVYVFNAQGDAFVIGTDGVYRSTDGGTMWEKRTVGLPAISINSLCIDPRGQLYLAGSYFRSTGSIYSFAADGKNWTACDTTGLPPFASFTQIACDVQGNVYGIVHGSHADGVYRTMDGGHTWTNVSSGLAPVGNQRVIASSPWGVLYCATQFGLYIGTNALTGVKEKGAAPSGFTLDQNYPNPFNPSTTIRYTLPSAANVTLKIYNMLGQDIAMPVNERQEPGSKSVRFDASRLSSGVYIYRLTAGLFVETKRMMVVK